MSQLPPARLRLKSFAMLCPAHFVLALLACLTVISSGCRQQAPPEEAPAVAVEDPRLSFPTPYRNVRPDVAYVSEETCAECHPNHADTFRKHPMGRSLAPVASVAAGQPYDARSHNPF